MSDRRPLKSTDRRRNPGSRKVKVEDTNGAGPSLAHIFSDRRQKNGNGKRAV